MGRLESPQAIVRPAFGTLGTSRGELLAIGTVVLLALPAVHADLDLGFVRAIYGPWNYSQDARVGLDADYDNKWWRPPAGARQLEAFARNSADAAGNNMTYVAGLYYLGDSAWFNYTRAVHMSGSEQTHTPSTVDPTYWLTLIEEPAIAVANLSLHCPIWGLVWDFELYLAEDPWETKDYSFDEPAIRAFSNETGQAIPILPRSQRHSWLRDNGLLDDFMAWQEEKVYRMAKATEERVHAINPDLRLGILGFSDSWRYWKTLEAFSTPRAPVTAWTEDTYGGYSESRIDHLNALFAEHGLNGKVVPGLYTVVLNPWILIENMERATRHNGVFWIYQHNGDAYRLANENAYSRAYEIFDRFVFFNLSRAQVLPSFGLHPGIEARPYLGPGGVTSILLKREVEILGAETVRIPLDSTELLYVGRNLTVLTLSSPEILRSDLPCLIHGAMEEDISRIRAWSLVQELGSLLSRYRGLGLVPLTELELMLSTIRSEYDEGGYDEVISNLGAEIQGAYKTVLGAVWPVVEEAMLSPRDSPLPLNSLAKISAARRMYDMGRLREGNSYLSSGLLEWSEAVPEHTGPLPPILLAGALLALGLPKAMPVSPRS